LFIKILGLTDLVLMMPKHINPLCQPPDNEPGVDVPAFPEVAKMAERAEKMMWPSTDISFAKDGDHFKKFLPEQQHTIATVVTFFREAEAAVLENLIARLCTKIKLHEARKYYGHQIGCEQVHENTYIKCFQAIIPDKELRRRYLVRARNLSCIAAKNEWARKYAEDPNTPVEVLILIFACVEGMFFSTSFAIIFYIRKHHPGLLPGLTSANDFINRDEGDHYEFAIMLQMLVTPPELRPSPELTKQIVGEACEIEMQFAEEALRKGGFPGLRTEDMKKYAMATADYIMDCHNLPPIYKVANPLTYMELIAVEDKGAFFETQMNSYSKIDMSERNGMWDSENTDSF
jgi:ribonucleotide reductase beta subunit family protein with ferritin-like domain